MGKEVARSFLPSKAIDRFANLRRITEVEVIS
jgi:hypothetical protein